jgi:bisphosphoglycerate-dependent phosphoglycerate mutase
MKKVEEKDGKVFIDGVEYEKKEKEQFMGVDVDFIFDIVEYLCPSWTTILAKNIRTDKNMMISNREFRAVRKLVHLGLQKAREDNDRILR